MIYVLCYTPSIDLYLTLEDDLKIDDINRTKDWYIKPGGKGHNISKSLSYQSIKNKLIMPVGEEIKLFKQDIDKNYAEIVPFAIKNPIRYNVKIRKNSENTEINSYNLTINDTNIKKIESYINKKIKKGDTLLISGYLPKETKTSVKKILSNAKKIGAKIVLDISNSDLTKDLISFSPLLFKPNEQDLRKMLDIERVKEERLIEESRTLIEKGVQNLIINLGNDGFILVNESCIIKVKWPYIQNKSTVSVGGIIVASFIGYIENNKNQKNKEFLYEDAFNYAVSASWTTLNNEKSPNIKEIEKNLKKIKLVYRKKIK